MTIAPITQADAELLQQQVDRKLVHWRARLNRMHPAEAMAVVGTLTGEAFVRLPPAQRMAAVQRWCNAINASVRASLG